MPPLALTLGDPAGIGPEIALAAWLARGGLDPLPPFFLVADPNFVERAADRMDAEAQALSAALPDAGCTTLCLDAAGDLVDSEAFADLLRAATSASVRRLSFVIGGPDGLLRDFVRRADRSLAFGRLTWPHQIVRILLAEQLYRTMTMLSGHPYHRA